MFDEAKHIHFVGIGGIGISALARLALATGKRVSGSDREESAVTKSLARLGAEIFYDQVASHLPALCDLVIYTIAVDDNNPELMEAKKRGMKTLTYPEALGEFSQNKFTIAIAGTHGKTTTTAMIGKILIAAGFDPTVIVGSLVDWDGHERSNLRIGKSQYLVVEACEFKRSFLSLQPNILVITNIDNDHLDYYRDLDDIKRAFTELRSQVKTGGKIITENEYRALVIAEPRLLVPGEHNIKNALAALAVADLLSIDRVTSVRTLSKFKGVWRRFEYRGQLKSGAKIYDDYAHHPTAIRATIETARGLTVGRIIVAFHPHLYSRTKHLFRELVESLALADQVLLLPIFAAREEPIPGITSGILAEAMAKYGVPAKVCQDFRELAEAIKMAAQKDDLVITMGAGDIYKVIDLML